MSTQYAKITDLLNRMSTLASLQVKLKINIKKLETNLRKNNIGKVKNYFSNKILME